ncbi:MAG: DUF2271 domain-containing protein [Spongiibacteraceae bacterium]|nr:DUF2271 domain-containing protein [Spongiibacteraceae bacterium]
MAASEKQATHYEIQLTLPSFESGVYERPYVAVWVASSKNKPVSVLGVWRDEERWLKDLKHFWRRVLRMQTLALDGVTGATKGPGEYRITWDGLDQEGKTLKSGQYKLCAEVAREHGDHSAKCIRFLYPLEIGLKEITLQGEFTRLVFNAK